MKYKITLWAIVTVFTSYSFGMGNNYNKAAAASVAGKQAATQQQEETKTLNNDCDFPLEDIGKDCNIKSRVESIGVFENISRTEEHSYGYVISLWKSDRQILGFFNLYEGSPEPDRSGPVIKGNIDDDGLHFTVWTKQSKAFKNWQQSGVYLYSFEGKLLKDKIEGGISFYDCSNGKLNENYDEKVVLIPTDMFKAENFEDWNEYYAPDLNVLIGF